MPIVIGGILAHSRLKYLVRGCIRLVHLLRAMARATVMILLYASLGLLARAGVVPEPALCCGWQSNSNALEPEKDVQFIVQALKFLFSRIAKGGWIPKGAFQIVPKCPVLSLSVLFSSLLGPEGSQIGTN